MKQTPKVGEYWHVQYGIEPNPINNIIVEILKVPDHPLGTNYTCQHNGDELMVNSQFFIEKYL